MEIITIIIAIIFVAIAFKVGKDIPSTKEKIDNTKLYEEQKRLEKQISDSKIRIQEIESEYNSKKQYINDIQQTTIVANQRAEDAHKEKMQLLEQEYQSRQQQQSAEYNKQVATYKDQIEQWNKQLQSLKQTYAAAIEAKKREQTIEDNPEKYCLQFEEDELYDMNYLNQIRCKLRKPVILGKVIWSTFVQKKTNSFISNILGTDETVCGVYKITDMLTGEAYIGQSVNVSNRWKEHMKSFVGAVEVSNSNQLYAAARRDGIENFSFELLEQCPQSELNAKEKFYIELYQTNLYGLNLTGGNNG